MTVRSSKSKHSIKVQLTIVLGHQRDISKLWAGLHCTTDIAAGDGYPGEWGSNVQLRIEIYEPSRWFCGNWT